DGADRAALKSLISFKNSRVITVIKSDFKFSLFCARHGEYFFRLPKIEAHGFFYEDIFAVGKGRGADLAQKIIWSGNHDNMDGGDRAALKSLISFKNSRVITVIKSDFKFSLFCARHGEYFFRLPKIEAHGFFYEDIFAVGKGRGADLAQKIIWSGNHDNMDG